MALFLVAGSNEYLVRTGLGIRDVAITRKGWRLIGQKAYFLDMAPRIYSLSLQAMTFEKLEFTMPAVFTIGPRDDPKSIETYAKTVAQATNKKEHLTELVRGIVEGESRVVAATMRMEDIFNSRKEFRTKIMDGVQTELDHFGLVIFNANIKQLSDTAGSEYFQYIRKKTHEGAVNQAKIEVAKAKYSGDVGAKTEEARTRKGVSLLEADTVVLENRNKTLVFGSEAELAVKVADYHRKTRIAQLEAENAAAKRTAELQTEVEKLRLLEKTEHEKANILALRKAQNQALMDTTDAKAYAQQRAADAVLFTKEKEAEGELAVATAQAEGLASLGKAFNGDYESVLQYLMIERGLFSELAKCSADAVQGINPKINVWTTGGDSSTPSTAHPFQDFIQSLPPLLSTIQDQTGIEPPAWLAQMGLLPAAAANEGQAVHAAAREVKGKAAAATVANGATEHGTANAGDMDLSISHSPTQTDSADFVPRWAQEYLLTRVNSSSKEVVGAKEFIHTCGRVLAGFGFKKGNCIPLVGTCRDELCRPLETLISKQFGSIFSISGLGGVLSCGEKGLRAGISHCPPPEIESGDTRPKYIFFVFPHLAVSGDKIGSLLRGVHGKPSDACGALIAIKNDIWKGSLRSAAEEEGIEYTALKEKVIKQIGEIKQPSLLTLTVAAYAAILNDLEKLINKTVDPHKEDYAVITGVQIHSDREVPASEQHLHRTTDFIAPGKSYAVVRGERRTLM